MEEPTTPDADASMRERRISVAPVDEEGIPASPVDDDRRPTRSDVFGRGMAVLSGWYVTLVLAVGLWILTLSDAEPDPDSCSFFCASPRSMAVFVGLVFGLPAMMLSFACGTGVVAVAARARMRSGVVAGTIAACAGLLGGVVLIWLGFQLW